MNPKKPNVKSPLNVTRAANLFLMGRVSLARTQQLGYRPFKVIGKNRLAEALIISVNPNGLSFSVREFKINDYRENIFEQIYEPTGNVEASNYYFHTILPASKTPRGLPYWAGVRLATVIYGITDYARELNPDEY